MTKIPPLKRFLGKKGWKEVNAILYEDSTLKVFEDQQKLRNEPVFEIKLETVALYLAFGKAANKYGPPVITEEERNFVVPNNFVAIPESKDRDKTHWLAAKDERGLKDLIQAIAETVDGKVNPPQMGKGPKYRYSSDDSECKWKTYWTTQMTSAQAPVEPTEENGTDAKYVATPLVAVLEHQQQQQQEKKESQEVKEPEKEKEKTPSPPAPAKNGAARLIDMAKLKAKPTPSPRQQHNYYHVEFEVPERVEALPFQSNHGLVDEAQEEEKTVLVRLVNGKRVKETVVTPKKEEPESSPAPPNYPPPPVPTLILEEPAKEHNGETETNVELQRDEVKEEPLIVSTKCISLESSPQECSAVISVASVEHTVSTTTEYVANGVTYTTTKETTTIQEASPNGAAVVH